MNNIRVIKSVSKNRASDYLLTIEGKDCVLTPKEVQGGYKRAEKYEAYDDLLDSPSLLTRIREWLV